MSLYTNVRDATRAALALAGEETRADVLGEIPDPQTRARGGGFFAAEGSIERDSPDRDQVTLYRRLYRENPYVNPGIDLRAGEVVRPGYTIRSDFEELTDALRTWADQCTIYAGEYDKPLTPQLWHDARAHDLDGTVLLEHMYDDPADPSNFSGFQSIDPLSVHILCYPQSNRLIRPNDGVANVPPDTPQNARGEWAAYVQNLGAKTSAAYQTGSNKESKDGAVPLSQEDVTKIVRNPMMDTPNKRPGSTGNAGQVRGMSLVEPVASEAIAVQNRRDDYNAALQNIAYPRASVTFEQTELPSGDIIEWTTGQMQKFINALRSRGRGAGGADGWRENRMHEDAVTERAFGENDTNYSDLDGSGGARHNSPGGIFGTPPGVETEWHAPELPDIEPTLRMSIDTIYGGMNVPKAYVGFGDNLNRDVTEPRVEQFDRDIKRIRRHISTAYTGVFRKKARFLIDRGLTDVPEGQVREAVESVEFTIESDQSKSPLKDEDFDAEAWYKYMQGWKIYVQTGLDTYLPPEHVIEKDLNLDYGEIEESLRDAAAAIESADSDAIREMQEAKQDAADIGPPTEDDVSSGIDESENAPGENGDSDN